MISHRELELQGIIKTLESKVYIMGQELQNVKKEEKERMAAAVSKEKKIIDEKDKTITLLMEDSKKLRQQSNLKHSRNIARIEDQYRSNEQSNVKLQTNKMQLETKLYQLTKYNQDKMKEKDRELEVVRQELQHLHKERKGMIHQLQNMNRFSVQASRRLPHREETLLWVNKLIEFMTKTSQMALNENKERQQALLAITLHTSQQLKQLNMEYSRNDSATTTDKLKFMEELKNLIFEVEQDCKSALRTNQEFWEGFSKVKNREEKEYIARLETEILSLQEAKDKQMQSFSQSLVNAERQKKSMLMSIQQLKCYYELRQKASRQEVDYFKRTIEDLIESQEIREREYQGEIRRMGEQVQHLTVKFYEKVELPINTVYNKIRQQVRQFQSSYVNFFTGSEMQLQIQQFQSTIVQYLTKLNQTKELREHIKEASLQTDKISQFIVNNHRGISHQTQQLQNNLSFSFSSAGVEEPKQTQKRLVYELATARKQIQKLKEHNRGLQGKHPPNRAQSTLTNAKLIELAAQNQSLKEKVYILQHSHHQKVIHHQQLVSQGRIGKINTAILEQLLEKNSSILQYIHSQEEFLCSLSKCVTSLNTVLLSPTQTFQTLIQQIKNISALPVTPPPKDQERQDFLTLQEMQAKRITYQDIIDRKQNAGNSIQKASNQLAKAIREILTQNQSSRATKTAQMAQQPERHKFSESKQLLEKRVKDVHCQRVKVREEMLDRLIFLEEKIKNMEHRATKKQSFPFIKFQESICKKLTELFSSLIPKEKHKDFKKITEEALSDATSKLRECLIQNQGLLKQIHMLKSVPSDK